LKEIVDVRVKVHAVAPEPFAVGLPDLLAKLLSRDANASFFGQFTDGGLLNVLTGVNAATRRDPARFELNFWVKMRFEQKNAILAIEQQNPCRFAVLTWLHG